MADVAEEEDRDGKGGEAFSASLEDRRRVFGENVLPSRKTKSLLSLMWLALKDKVLVRTRLYLLLGAYMRLECQYSS